MSFQQFRDQLLSLSIEKTDLKRAINEWVFDGIAKNEESHCICGHAIAHNYFIKNINNGNGAVVGSVCIKQFMAENENLLGNLNRFVFEHERNPCIMCGTLTKHPDQMCKRCHNPPCLYCETPTRCVGRTCTTCALRSDDWRRRVLVNRERQAKWDQIAAFVPQEKLSKWESDFINSLEGQYMTKGKLSERQLATIKKIIVRGN